MAQSESGPVKLTDDDKRKLSAFIGRLASDQDGERSNAASLIGTLLGKYGKSWQDVAQDPAILVEGADAALLERYKLANAAFERQNAALLKENARFRKLFSVSERLKSVATRLGGASGIGGTAGKAIGSVCRWAGILTTGPLTSLYLYNAAKKRGYRDTNWSRYDEGKNFFGHVGATAICAALWYAAYQGDSLLNDHQHNAAIDRNLAELSCESPENRKTPCPNIYVPARVSPIFGHVAGPTIVEHEATTNRIPSINQSGTEGTAICSEYRLRYQNANMIDPNLTWTLSRGTCRFEPTQP